MSFAMCMGGEMLFAVLAFFLVAGGACLALAIFATVGLAKWAAARRLRLAEGAK